VPRSKWEGKSSSYLSSPNMKLDEYLGASLLAIACCVNYVISVRHLKPSRELPYKGIILNFRGSQTIGKY
jgi:hypothetical protein